MALLVVLFVFFSLYLFNFRLLKFFITVEISLVVLFFVMCLSFFSYGLVFLLFFVALFSSEAALSFSILVSFLNSESFNFVKSNSFGFF